MALVIMYVCTCVDGYSCSQTILGTVEHGDLGSRMILDTGDSDTARGYCRPKNFF